ncbi:MAG TPA: hypothetical protein VFH68_02910 [Polyangia bacterium]|nr:hypothetical protein [Polyangia bacterium]
MIHSADMLRTMIERSLSATVGLLLLLLLAAVVRAQPLPAISDEAHPRRTVSITLSPIHLVLPVVELTGEWRAMDKLGVAVVLGGGKVRPENALSGQPSIPVWEAGAQVRYYLLGDFRHGMQLGAETIYMHASTESGNVRAAANGISAGGFAGYKVMVDAGFTFDAQLGYQFIGIGADATDGQNSASGSNSSSGVLLNLNVGWSF